jgi:hypothetical protein
MRTVFGAGLVAGLVAAVGCGKADVEAGYVGTGGTIQLDGQPASNTLVTYIPQGTTGGTGGSGMTDSTGRYEIVSPQGKRGLPPGKYKVTVSRRLNPDGSPPPADEWPIESQARETLPAKYSDKDKTELSINLAEGDKRSFDFSLQSGKKN